MSGLSDELVTWLSALDSGRPIPEGEHEVFARLVASKFCEANAPVLMDTGVQAKVSYAIMTDATMMVSMDLAGVRVDVTLHLNGLDLFDICVEWQDLFLGGVRSVDVGSLGGVLFDFFEQLMLIGTKEVS